MKTVAERAWRGRRRETVPSLYWQTEFISDVTWCRTVLLLVMIV